MNQMKEFGAVADIPLIHAPHGIDIDLFDRKPEYRDELIVGINGSVASPGKKGFNIVSKACEIVGLKYVSSPQKKGGGHLTKEEMPKFYEDIVIYCNMSRSEGCNNSIMEAGGMGKMVIATPVGAVPEIIEDYKTGFLCDRSVDCLVEKLKECINNRDILKTCGHNLHDKILDEWGWDTRIDSYKNLFREILK